MKRQMPMISVVLFCGLVCAMAPLPAAAAALPIKVRACSETTIKNIGHRLQGASDSGSVVQYANGGVQISYETISAIHRSHIGDKVRVCLVSIPQNCPPGDDRGRVYKATNLRTGESWEAPDSQHSCGGA